MLGENHLHIQYNEKNLLDSRKVGTSRDEIHHKEEGSSRFIRDHKDQEKIQNFLWTCIHPSDTENYTAEIVNIHANKLSIKDVNVNKGFEIRNEQVENFIKHFLKGFETHLVSRLKLCLFFRKVLINKWINDKEITENYFIYSRVIAMQLANEALTVENLFKHELASILNSVFNDDSDLRPT